VMGLLAASALLVTFLRVSLDASQHVEEAAHGPRFASPGNESRVTVGKPAFPRSTVLAALAFVLGVRSVVHVRLLTTTTRRLHARSLRSSRNAQAAVCPGRDVVGRVRNCEARSRLLGARHAPPPFCVWSA
jgi:hypothetical protein